MRFKVQDSSGQRFIFVLASYLCVCVFVYSSEDGCSRYLSFQVKGETKAKKVSTENHPAFFQVWTD